MSGVRCSQCGLVNFADAEKCKRCGQSLDNAEATSSQLAAQSTIANPSSKNLKGITTLLIVIGGLAFIFSIFWVVGRILNPPTASLPSNQSAVAVPEPTVEFVSRENVEPAKRAIDSLFKLNSATEAGLNYMQYSDRVLTAKGDLDAALRDMRMNKQADRKFTPAALAAVDSYIEARKDWGEYIEKHYSEEGKQKILNLHWGNAQSHILEAQALMPK